jgi:hypothetical protein
LFNKLEDTNKFKKMIKNLLSLAAAVVLTIGGAFAQQINNAGFETWSSTGNTAGKATGWAGYGDIGLAIGAPNFGLLTTYFKETTIKNSGSSSIKLETKDYVAIVNSYLSGFAQLGTFDATSFEIVKVPYAFRPSNFSGYANYQPTTSPSLGIDTGVVQAVFTKWNNATNKSDVIGYAEKLYTAATSGVEAFNIQCQWASFENPDSMYVFMASSIGDSISLANHVGSKLFVDDLAYSNFVTGKKETLTSGIVTKIAPNPVTNVLNLITSDKNIGGVVRIMDVTGKQVKEASINSIMNNINIDELGNGVYFYQLFDTNDKIAASGKFSVVK